MNTSKIYTMYSPSHESLYFSYFLPMVSKWHEVVVDKQEQNGTGSFDDVKPFALVMRRKVEFILSAFEQTSPKEWFVFSDCDITYFKDYEEDMEKRLSLVDLVAQNDSGGICAGFMGIRKNKVTQTFFATLLDYIDDNLYRCDYGEGFHDQQGINELIGIIRSRPTYRSEIQRPTFSLVKYNDGYGNLDHILPGLGTKWNETIDIPFCSIPYMWHANHIIGVDAKLKMMEQVTHKVNEMRKAGNT